MGEIPGRCTICNGTKEDHANSRHAYTENEGELVTPQQKARQEQQNNGRTVIPMPPGLLTHPVNVSVTDRLVNTLIDKGIINGDEALYILSGREMPKGG